MAKKNAEFSAANQMRVRLSKPENNPASQSRDMYMGKQGAMTTDKRPKTNNGIVSKYKTNSEGYVSSMDNSTV